MYYMPHCELDINQRLVAELGRLGVLSNCLVFGNRLCLYGDRLRCARFTEVEQMHAFVRDDVFNDCCLHVF